MSMPLLVVKPAVPFADADDLVAGFVHQQRGVGADIAEALNDDARIFAAHSRAS